MRYSNQAPIAPLSPVSPGASNAEFFRAVRDSAGDDALTCAILLVGAVDERALAVRRAQAVLRYDRLTSYWSHAALLLGASSGTIRGVEVTLDPEDALSQSASRNGATIFALERYADRARYPNIAIFCLEFPKKSAAQQTIVEASLDPNRERTRYPFYDQLATWSRYAYAPDATMNPLLEGVALPGAAYCEYAYGAASIDLTPGATGNHACPEVLWATMKRWGGALDAMLKVKVHGYTILRDAVGTPAPSLPSLGEEFAGAKGAEAPGDTGKTGRVRERARSRSRSRGKRT